MGIAAQDCESRERAMLIYKPPMEIVQ